MNGRSDPISLFDLDRAAKGGLSGAAVALFVAQGSRDPEALVAAQAKIVARDSAIHAIRAIRAIRAI